ncbi:MULTISPECIES: hypothetical protein [unclassified Frankia]|uniref:hypothetical protein n=1 Tax=unclassified Frankia TaxID=2632575 RepID=UPI0020241FBB
MGSQRWLGGRLVPLLAGAAVAITGGLAGCKPAVDPGPTSTPTPPAAIALAATPTTTASSQPTAAPPATPTATAAAGVPKTPTAAQPGAPAPAPAPASSFPNAGNTGVPAGVTLTDYTGPREITKANTVIQNARIKGGGRLTISAPGVVIRNSVISTDDTFGVSVNSDQVANASVTVEDSEFIGSYDPQPADEMAIRGRNWTVRRVEIRGFRDGGGIDGGNVVEDSYLHDFVVSSACEHIDGLQGLGNTDNITIRHNTIDIALDHCIAGVVQLGTEYGSNHNVTVDNNWLAGGSWIFYSSLLPGGSSDEIKFINNHLSKKYFPNYGVYGVAHDWNPGVAGVQWSGNVDADTGKVIPAPVT